MPLDFSWHSGYDVGLRHKDKSMEGTIDDSNRETTAETEKR